MGGHALNLVVRGHDDCGIGVADDVAEGNQKALHQPAIADLERGQVDAPFGRSVDEMLERRENLVAAQGARPALQPAHGGDAHLRDQMRVLTEHLLDAAEPGVERHIDHRRQRHRRAAHPRFAAGYGEHALDQRRVPRAAQGRRNREHRGVPRGIAMRGFLVE